MNVTDSYDRAIEAVLFTREEIEAAIGRLAQQIAADHRGQPLVLSGSPTRWNSIT